MKKFLALALAIVMMAAIAVPAFALDQRYGDGNDNQAEDNYLTDAEDVYTDNNTVVKYGVAQAYTVTIPAEIQLHEFHGTDDDQTVGYVYGVETIGVSDVVIAKGEELNIYINSANYNNGWRLIDTNGEGWDNDTLTSDPVSYKVTVADATVTEGVAAVDATQYLTSTEYDSEPGIAAGDGETTTDGLVLTCANAAGNAGTTGSALTRNLYFSSKGTAQEGTYKDTITFTVRIQLTATN